ncbi:hypothetical protein EJ04DRAFT_452677, partial [Polyplosphaeria fusca]
KRNEKWQLSIFYAALATSTVCLLNIVVTIWVFATNGTTYGSADLYEGSCEKTKNLNIGVHLIINIFSSAILSGSNYTMQCLSSPTRAEVDDAHARGSWLDIGVPSIRNFRSIATRRRWIWLLLAVSSIPLYLFYNSAVFTTLSANSYLVYVTNEPWLSSANLTVPVSEGYGPYPSELVDIHLWKAHEAGELERLEPSERIDAYTHSFISTRSNLLVITSNPSNSFETGKIFNFTSGGDITITGSQDSGNLDPCEEYEFYDVDALGIRQNPSSWTLNNRTVDYCLSEKTAEHCKLRLNATMAAIVIITTLLKALLITTTYLTLKPPLLLTVGDAITSFLSRPDPFTTHSPFLSKADATRKTPIPSPRPFNPTRKRTFAATSRRQTILTFSSTTLGLVVISALLAHALTNLKGAPPSALFSLGFGRPSEHTLLTFAHIRRRGIRPSNLLAIALIANAPQALLSLAYLALNALTSAMLSAREWAAFAHARKGLRVQARPRGAQRESYFLQLPWRYGVPLAGAGAALHWLASQSVSLVGVEWWENVGDWGREEWHDFGTCGVSPLAVLVFLLAGAGVLLGVVWLGMRRLGSAMPVVGSCSLGVAGGCQVEQGREEEQERESGERKVQWGAVEWVDGSGEVVRRCGFSSGSVTYPEEGVLYS